MRRSVVSLIVLLCLAGPAFADNDCWHGADYSTTAAGGHEDSKVIWGTSGALGSGNLPIYYCQMMVANNAASTVWAMVFDSATLPANGTKPKEEFPVTTVNSNSRFGYPDQMNNGVTVACSSTEGTLTVTAASDCNFHVTIAK